MGIVKFRRPDELPLTHHPKMKIAIDGVPCGAKNGIENEGSGDGG
jgi:hypothetical protein